MQSTFYCHDSLDQTFIETSIRAGIPVKQYDASQTPTETDYFVCSLQALLTVGGELLIAKVGASRILVIEERNAEAERVMLDKGLALLLTRDLFVKHATALAHEIFVKKESLLCIGTGSSDTEIIKSIARLFGYSSLYAANVEEAFAAVQDTIELVIHDLSCPQIDQFQFVKRMTHSALKSLPYVAYKSSGSRIDMSDIQSGIKSFTRMILAKYEVYSLLAVNLFKKEYFPLVSLLASRQISDLQLFGSESFKKIYFAHNDSFFSENHESVCEQVDETGAVCIEIESLIARFECIRWLVEKNDVSPRINNVSSRNKQASNHDS